MSKPILCLDFDGVVHHYISKYTEPDEVNDPPTPGALEALNLYNEHFDINIFSSRSHQLGGRDAMFTWCRHHFGYDFAVKNLTFPLHKPPALVTLDDRALTFTGVWPSVAELKAFRPWNKK